MYSIEEIKELIKTVDESGIGELEIKNEEKATIAIRKEKAEPVQQVSAPLPQGVPTPPPAQTPEQSGGATSTSSTDIEPADDCKKITSPMVGTFYRSPSPDTDPYVQVGDRIEEASVVCIVEAMKLMNELEAEVSGEITEILVENGELVDYGQPLFFVK
ncbi:acetyl-CoA carboxylase biotin carboxyl carrier protein [Geomicrobium halophilum]|uniref:Biotin carboxyl carrier protein of acetyl-CoA carboxylase n=1 Tax=Geomicrobium halophilum TaxID=549000 RepID=A0A841PW02_9BACL|nr:acetyl-CoA carboxylase biotin carboxyl carrier protein [Geomicrobium halophilum]MBB6448433.1 acetyl-CoA carboxylase biotin carboxyl carrier protein [Geomicrobium halophilum]